MIKKLFLVCLLGLSLSWSAKAQNQSTLDSLQNIYRTSTDAKVKLLTLTNIAFQYRDNNPDTCIFLANQALEQSIKLNFKKGQAQAYNNIGVGYRAKANYPMALDYHQKSLKIREELNDIQGIGRSLNNIAVVYLILDNYDMALNYHQQSLELKRNNQDKAGVATSLNNIALVYKEKNDLKNALAYDLESLAIKEELKDERGIASSLHNIADIYQIQGKLTEALDFYQKSIVVKEKLKDLLNISTSLDGVARIYQKQKDYDKSLEYALKGLKIVQDIKAVGKIEILTKTIYESYKLKGDYENAIKYLEMYQESHDSVFNIDKTKVVANLESRLLLEKKEKELEITKKQAEAEHLFVLAQASELEIAKQQAEVRHYEALALSEKDKRKQDSLFNLSQKASLEFEKLKAENKAAQLEVIQEKEKSSFQQQLTLVSLIGLVGILLFAYLMYRSRQKEKQAKEITILQAQEVEEQKKELEQTLEVMSEQKQLIEKKNQNITDSITYSLRIQNAIIPTETELKKHFDCFVFFRPRDIVSGDFYWFSEKNNKKILALADCTGHGVSGAFMTMIANNILNQIVHDMEIYEPDQILNLTQILLEKTLSQSDDKVADGMDIAIITLENQNFVDLKILYAGAMNPLYYVQNKEFNEIKADKVPIGGQKKDNFSYQKHEILIKNSSSTNNPLTLYLCSDGFQDQFGGEMNKKFMVKNLKKILFEISEKNTTEQKQILEKTFDLWKDKSEQTDDVLLIGIKL